MQVIQATFGTFHQFHLARELQARGQLKHIYSTYPWRRLQREGLPRTYVSTFPWVHTLHLAAGRYLSLPEAIDGRLSDQISPTFDAWLCKQLTPCDAYVAISGAGERSGKRAQALGAKYICDRGSSHQQYQQNITAEEYAIWGVPVPRMQHRLIERSEAEYANADAITVLSEFARRTFIEHGVPASKIHMIPLGVRLDDFRPTTPPATDTFEVLFAGTVCFRKGIPYLLEAFEQLRHPRKKLRIVGPMRQEILPYLKSRNLDHVEIIGSQPQSELARLMSRSHVLVLPSIEDGFGMVMTQAMACGCPVISTENTGGPGLYNDGVEGFIVPIRSPQAILLRMQQLADDPALRQTMSEQALRRVQSVGGWHQYGEAYSSFLKTLCGQSCPP